MSSRPRRESDTEMTTGARASATRRTVFRVIAAIMAVSGLAFGLFTVVGVFLASQAIHAFHNAVVGALLLVLSAPAAMAAFRAPERSMSALIHLAVVGLAGVVTMGLSLTIDPFTAPFVLLVGVLWILRPDRGRPVPAGRPSPLLLVLVLASAIPLVTYALDHAELQRIDSSSEHAEFFHWVETSFYALAVLLLGLLVAIRPAASRLSAWSAGVALAVLGGASLALLDRASALATPWAWAALAGSLVFIAVAEWERRRPPAADPRRA
jgi:hypothetical protein